MAPLDISVATRIRLGGGVLPLQPLLGLAIGVGGGALQSVLLATSLMNGVLYGALFGAAFGFCFSRRATSPGAGLIWGVAAALLLWIVGPAGILSLRRPSHFMGMMSNARATFSQLVGLITCLGMPVGITLGTWGALDSQRPQLK